MGTHITGELSGLLGYLISWSYQGWKTALSLMLLVFLCIVNLEKNKRFMRLKKMFISSKRRLLQILFTVVYDESHESEYNIDWLKLEAAILYTFTWSSTELSWAYSTYELTCIDLHWGNPIKTNFPHVDDIYTAINVSHIRLLVSGSLLMMREDWFPCSRVSPWWPCGACTNWEKSAWIVKADRAQEGGLDLANVVTEPAPIPVPTHLPPPSFAYSTNHHFSSIPYLYWG